MPPKNQEKRSFASKKLAGYMESTTKQRRKTVITTQMATIITALSKLECSFMKDELGWTIVERNGLVTCLIILFQSKENCFEGGSMGSMYLRECTLVSFA